MFTKRLFSVGAAALSATVISLAAAAPASAVTAREQSYTYIWQCGELAAGTGPACADLDLDLSMTFTNLEEPDRYGPTFRVSIFGSLDGEDFLSEVELDGKNYFDPFESFEDFVRNIVSYAELVPNFDDFEEGIVDDIDTVIYTFNAFLEYYDDRGRLDDPPYASPSTIASISTTQPFSTSSPCPRCRATDGTGEMSPTSSTAAATSARTWRPSRCRPPACCC